ncbi:MAG: hypothetical protein J0M10_00095 [Chitinophagales bacterium]|nr:hypothetical protein [Chitinophagales bacterium]
MWFINIIYWLHAFIGPVLLFLISGLAVNKENWIMPLLIAGVIMGILLAEFIRRKYGLSTFFSRIYGPNEMDKKWKKKE